MNCLKYFVLIFWPTSIIFWDMDLSLDPDETENHKAYVILILRNPITDHPFTKNWLIRQSVRTDDKGKATYPTRTTKEGQISKEITVYAEEY